MITNAKKGKTLSCNLSVEQEQNSSTICLIYICQFVFCRLSRFVGNTDKEIVKIYTTCKDFDQKLAKDMTAPNGTFEYSFSKCEKSCDDIFSLATRDTCEDNYLHFCSDYMKKATVVDWKTYEKKNSTAISKMMAVRRANKELKKIKYETSWQLVETALTISGSQ